MRAAVTCLVVAALLGGTLPAAASAADATIKGTVAGPGLPDAGEGVTAVRAVNAETGAVDADYTSGGRDKWSLQVLPGPYVLGATTVPFAGGKLVDRLLAFAGARSGKTEKLKLKLKRKRRHHRAAPAGRAARVADGFGDVDVDYPAIVVKEFDVQATDPELGVMRQGMSAMVTTDLVGGFPAKEGCKAVIVERSRIGDVINEQKLQQLPNFDPGTRVQQGHLIRDNASVSGTIVESGGQVTITATYSDRRTGRTRNVSVQGAKGNIFALEQELAKKLLDAICGALPDAYAGTFDGKLVDSEKTMSWSGTVTYERLLPPDPDGQQCEATETACWRSTGGSVTWQVSTTPGADCTYQAGPKTADVPPGLGFISMDPAGGETPGYAGHLGGPDSSANGTEQCPGDDQPRQVTYHLVCCFNTNFGFPWGNYATDRGFHLQGSYMDDGGLSSNWDLTGR